eukprot:745995-Hanusia_phi.AAC.9
MMGKKGFCDGGRGGEVWGGDGRLPQLSSSPILFPPPSPLSSQVSHLFLSVRRASSLAGSPRARIWMHETFFCSSRLANRLRTCKTGSSIWHDSGGAGEDGGKSMGARRHQHQHQEEVGHDADKEEEQK